MDTPLTVTPSWVLDPPMEHSIRVVDTRPPPYFAAGHIPGSVNLPAAFLITPSGDPVGADVFARLLGRIGIRSEDTIVTVDDGSAQGSSLLFWILESSGHQPTLVLEGGVGAWNGAGLPVEKGQAVTQPSEYPTIAAGTPAAVCAADLAASLGAGQSQLVDSRSPEEYAGGHIPGATHVEWSEHFTWASGWGNRLGSTEIRQIYEDRGVDPDRPIVVYCHAGPRATAAYVSLRQAGFADISVYLRGWREWGATDSLPVEFGADHSIGENVENKGIQLMSYDWQTEPHSGEPGASGDGESFETESAAQVDSPAGEPGDGSDYQTLGADEAAHDVSGLGLDGSTPFEGGIQGRLTEPGGHRESEHHNYDWQRDVDVDQPVQKAE